MAINPVLVIYSEAIDYDRRWLLTLFEQAGVTPDFSFGSIFDVVDTNTISAYEAALSIEFVTHRALDDVPHTILNDA